MWLTLIDVSLKMHWSPYENKLGGFMEKFNDCLVLILSYFPFVFTDLTPTAEDKYFIGWFYNAILGIMILANVGVMVMTTFESLAGKIKECNFKSTEIEN